MNEQRNRVSIQDTGNRDKWEAVASFHWFVDAVRYAKRFTKGDKQNRIAVIEYDGSQPNYVQNGQLLYDLEDAD